MGSEVDLVVVLEEVWVETSVEAVVMALEDVGFPAASASQEEEEAVVSDWVVQVTAAMEAA